jgi:hypothetical protein
VDTAPELELDALELELDALELLLDALELDALELLLDALELDALELLLDALELDALELLVEPELLLATLVPPAAPLPAVLVPALPPTPELLAGLVVPPAPPESCGPAAWPQPMTRPTITTWNRRRTLGTFASFRGRGWILDRGRSMRRSCREKAP